MRERTPIILASKRQEKLTKVCLPSLGSRESGLDVRERAGLWTSCRVGFLWVGH